jgi:hypothetical protein
VGIDIAMRLSKKNLLIYKKTVLLRFLFHSPQSRQYHVLKLRTREDAITCAFDKSQIGCKSWAQPIGLAMALR